MDAVSDFVCCFPRGYVQGEGPSTGGHAACTQLAMQEHVPFQLLCLRSETMTAFFFKYIYAGAACESSGQKICTISQEQTTCLLQCAAPGRARGDPATATWPHLRKLAAPGPLRAGKGGLRGLLGLLAPRRQVAAGVGVGDSARLPVGQQRDRAPSRCCFASPTDPY